MKESTWAPNAGRDKGLDSCIKAVKNDIISGLSNNVKVNLTSEEEQAMNELLNDNDIVNRTAH